MILFGYGLDPYLERLRDKLEGIVIHSASLPVQGPVLQGEDGLPPLYVEERFTAFAYADDVKNSIVGMHELIMVDEETKLFEQASGCELHRDPASQKVKFLPLGKWRGKLKQDDLPAQCAHVSNLGPSGHVRSSAIRYTEENTERKRRWTAKEV